MSENSSKDVIWSVEFVESAHSDLKKLDKAASRHITQYIAERLIGPEDPKRFGKPLSGELKGLWRYRVGDYRLICHIHDQDVIVLVLRIAHRKAVYKKAI